MRSLWASIHLRDLDLEEEALVQELAQQILTKSANSPSSEMRLCLDCSGNRLGPSVPLALCRTPCLLTLNLSANRISDLDNVVEHATFLESLTLDSNALTEIPSSLSRLTNLRSLSISHNEVRTVPHSIASLPNLEELDISCNPIDLGSLSDELLLKTETEIVFNPEGHSAPVIPGLYLSGQSVAHDLNTLKSLNVTHILSVTDSRAAFPGKFSFLGVPLIDLPDQSLKIALEIAIDFISAALREGGTVLVHCMAGVSRSASVIIGFLMHHLDLPFERAFVMTRRARPCISPNRGFVSELRKLEPELRQSGQKKKQNTLDITK